MQVRLAILVAAAAAAVSAGCGGRRVHAPPAVAVAGAPTYAPVLSATPAGGREALLELEDVTVPEDRLPGFLASLPPHDVGRPAQMAMRDHDALLATWKREHGAVLLALPSIVS